MLNPLKKVPQEQLRLCGRPLTVFSLLGLIKCGSPFTLGTHITLCVQIGQPHSAFFCGKDGIMISLQPGHGDSTVTD